MKICIKCGDAKGLSEFNKAQANRDGHRGHCRLCEKEINATWRKNNPDKVRARNRNYYNNNKEKEIEKGRAYYENNKEREKEKSRIYYRNNKEETLARKKEWIKNNPDKIRATNNKRRTRIAGNGGSFTDKEWQDLCDKYNNECLCCGEEKPLEADHVIPVSWKGGTSNIDNIQPLCKPCNSSKGVKDTDYR